jgi:cytochrome c oxidase subunit 1
MSPGKTIVGPQTYNVAFTLHGAIMIFLFMLPIISAFMNYLIPLHIGARDMAFPRLNAASYWLYVISAILFLLSFFPHPPDTGWTMYPPYSVRTQGNVSLLTLALFVLGFSSIAGAINFIVTIHKLRAPGMTFHRLPLFIWSAYGTALIQLVATPVLGVTLILLFLEKFVGFGFFDPGKGGDPLAFQNFFWFYSHPVVYVMILPAMGIVSEIIPVFARKPIFGYRAIAYSSLAIATISFLVWGHHMFVSGMPDWLRWVFSAATMLVAVPSGIKTFNWLATLYKGSIEFAPPMLYALAFIALFTLGGLTGMFLGTLATDVQLHDTYFVVAHFHYTMFGGTVIGLLAAAHYWYPKMFGRMYNVRLAKVAFWIIFWGFNLAFFTMFFLGLGGLPRRYYDYPPRFHTGNEVATFGSYLLGLGFLLVYVNFIVSCFKGKKAPPNPWGALTLEWRTSSPPPAGNFEKIPEVTEWPYSYGKE